MASELAPGGILIELRGVPAWVVGAFKLHAAPEPTIPPTAQVPPRQNRPRERRSRSRTRSSARGSPDDDPAPGRAGLPTLRVIPPAEFRRALDAALGGRR